LVTQELDGISFEMKEAHNFSFLREYGRVFTVFSRNDSGNISFGTDDGERKCFIKVAGTKTAESIITPEEAIGNLKKAVVLYLALSHPRLIQLVEHFEYDDVYVAVFQWVDADCLFDYWNFETYAKNPSLIPPRERFKALPYKKKLAAFGVMFEFLCFVESMNYIAVDFYDGSILYDFDRDAVTICDIDFFRKAPSTNDIGEAFWGTKRLKAPEEYILSAVIDSVTNVFTLGALLLHFFGTYSEGEVERMYKTNMFAPCRLETWELSEALYQIVCKAVSPERSKRYDSMKNFYEKWKQEVFNENS
jgi:serine/threonine-protein kinase